MKECIGLHSMNFRAQDGGQVNGVKIFYTFEKPHVDGLACGSCFVSAEKLPRMTFMPELGASFDVRYNEYGKVADIVPA